MDRVFVGHAWQGQSHLSSSMQLPSPSAPGQLEQQGQAAQPSAARLPPSAGAGTVQRRPGSPAMTEQVCWADDGVGSLGEWLTGLPNRPVGAGQVEEFTQAALGNFVRLAVRLFSAAGAAVVLYLDGRPGWVIASDASSLAFRLTEATVGDGPDFAAARSGQVTQSEDLHSDPRWPDLAPAAVERGVRAVLAVPINGPGHPIGVCSLTAGSPARWSDPEVDALLAEVGILSSLLQISAEACAGAVLAGQLQYALDHRVVIEQAKGALIERMGVSPEMALALLRDTARSSRRRLADVAGDVLAGSNPDFGAAKGATSANRQG